MKTPKPEPERVPQAPKRPTEARDAREIAKKLIKSGVITAPKMSKRPEQAFKRPRGLERKLNSSDKAVCSYQPFSASQPEDEENEATRSRVKGLYDSFVSAQSTGDDKSTSSGDKQTASTKTETKGKSGNTIFVCGYKITEEYLRKHFETFGRIVNVTMETDKK